MYKDEWMAKMFHEKQAKFSGFLRQAGREKSQITAK